MNMSSMTAICFLLPFFIFCFCSIESSPPKTTSTLPTQLLSKTGENPSPQRRLLGGNAACPFTKKRVRRSWDTMTQTARSKYLLAIETSISTGLYTDFVKVHMDAKSEMEAHDTCGFTLWHRHYVLAFENMLRSQHPRFACVTIPYWDTPTQFKNMANGKCKSIESCSKIITGIGGPVTSVLATRTFNGKKVRNYCASGRPYKALCDDHEKCGCMPRNNLKKTSIPTGSSFISLFNIISSSTDYATYGLKVQNGIHNEMHGAIGGIMSTFASPVDALFFSWHSTVDMLHALWHTCHLKDPMTISDKKSSAYAFNQERECRYTAKARKNGPSMRSTRDIYMRVNGSDVRSHPKIGQFFRDVGHTYADFADARSMGDFSYTYDYPSDFNRMLNDDTLCPTAPKRTPKPTPAPEPILFTPPPSVNTPPPIVITLPPVALTLMPVTTEPVQKPTLSPPVVPLPPVVVLTTAPPFRKPAAPISSTDSTRPNTTSKVTPKSSKLSYFEWYDLTRNNLRLQFPDDPMEVNRQLEYIECIGFNEKFGVQNFTAEFIQEFLEGKTLEPRCELILESIARNETKVAETKDGGKWGDIESEHLIGGTAEGDDQIMEEFDPSDNLADDSQSSAVSTIKRNAFFVWSWSFSFVLGLIVCAF